MAGLESSDLSSETNRDFAERSLAELHAHKSEKMWLGHCTGKTFYRQGKKRYPLSRGLVGTARQIEGQGDLLGETWQVFEIHGIGLSIHDGQTPPASGLPLLCYVG